MCTVSTHDVAVESSSPEIYDFVHIGLIEVQGTHSVLDQAQFACDATRIPALDDKIGFRLSKVLT